MPKTKMGIDGILIVNKPEGKTSFSVVAWLKRLTGEKRVGHSGTLDTIATGVLPVCLGQATRVTQFLTNSSKTYLAQIELGITTDTFDRQGKIVERRDPGGITVTRVEEALIAFRGVIDQTPPAFSAVKQGGRRSYELARAGIPVKLKSRRVEITKLELISCRLPQIEINVDCSKGTYIRSLANDIGQYLGCGAHLKNLKRLRCGQFSIQDALSPDEIEDAFHKDTWKNFIHPVDSPLSNWKAIIVDKKIELDIRNGCPLPLNEAGPFSDEYCRAYDLDGNFLAVLHFIPEKRLWHPEKVFSMS
ncbi:MAG: tRNA pseudouridine(55) synthase TruB [Dehalococcoidia bacterium]|nr:tRNA pseudouridine(55) synthase TruB [Dehalococcoidia bacterium]